MKRFLHKLLAAMMAAIMLFSALPTSALAQITVSNALRIGASGYSIDGGNQVEVGGELRLTGTEADAHRWSSSDDSIAIVTSYNGREAIVSGRMANKEATIAHEYQNGGGEWTTETINIHVVAAQITFDANGGSGAVDPIEVFSYGEEITLPGSEGLSRDGYRLMGWGYSKVAGRNTTDTTIYAPNTQLEVRETRTLYAVWATSDSAAFYIRLDGKIPHEPGSFPATNYSGKMEGRVQYDTFYANDSDAGVASYLEQAPSTEDIWKACNKAGGDIKFTDGSNYNKNCTLEDFENHYYVLWYVVKREPADGVHVDGVLLKKSLYNVNYNANYAGFAGQLPMGQQYSENEIVVVTTDTLSRKGYPRWRMAR